MLGARSLKIDFRAEPAAILDRTLQKWYTDIAEGESNSKICAFMNAPGLPMITKDCPNTGHKDCWTAEYRAKTSEKRRKKPNCKGSSVMTGKIKCVGGGCNFRRATQPSSTSESGKAYYWRCAERDGCGTVGLREDVLKPFIAETLSIAEFDDGEFDRQIDHIDVLSAAEMVFLFKDGRTVNRTWEQPKRTGRPWTDEQRAKFKESIKGRYTPEIRQQMSEHMKQLRKERGKAWCKEK